MNGGNLSDQQLKEFDAYLNSDSGNKTDSIKPATPAAKPSPVTSNNDADLDKIVELHQKKVNLILDLLDKIDAKAHKDIVADLVDEMQYQKSIVAREQDQLASLKKLISLANEAVKK